MTRYLPLLFLVAIAAEIASIIWVGQLLGVIPTLLLMALGAMIGVRTIKSAGMNLAQALRAPVQTAAPLKALGGQAAARAASGLLFLLPGFFSDLIGLLLFLPPLRRWIGTKLRVDTSSVPPGGAGRFDRVIEIEAVEIRGDIEPPDRWRS